MGMSDWRIRRPTVFPVTVLLLSYSSALVSSSSAAVNIVTLDSIELFKTHDWLATTLAIFFHCQGEKEIVLPDVKAKNTPYTFKGQESWQPLTELNDIKCKRCGLYQKDSIITSNHVLDEWEFCASDFTRSDGRYIHFKDQEFNATFLCPDCVSLGNASDYSYKDLKRYLIWISILVIGIVVAILVISGLVAAWKFWQKRKRQQEQARFLKLFEEGDDIEDELGIGPLN